MSSPFRRHQQRVLARNASHAMAARLANETAPAPVELKADTPAGHEYATLRVLLHENLRVLSDIASHEARIPKKAEFAKAFAPWIDGVLEADQPVQDEILTTNMVWAIDYGDFDYALRLGQFAVKHHLVLPERYNRTVSCFLTEDIAELALKNKDRVRHDQLVELAELTADADMPDPARAKLCKALGRSWADKARTFDPSADSAPAGGARAYAEEALKDFNRAFALDTQIGVRTDIKSIQKLLKQLTAAAEAPSGT